MDFSMSGLLGSGARQNHTARGQGDEPSGNENSSGASRCVPVDTQSAGTLPTNPFMCWISQGMRQSCTCTWVHAGTWCSTTLCSRPSRYIYPWPLASVTMLAVLAQCPNEAVSHKVCKRWILAGSQCLRTLGYNCIFHRGFKL